MDERPQIIVNSGAIEQAMARKGVRSLQELAHRLGVHRNTLGAYLAGERALPEALGKMLTELEVLPSEAFVIIQPAREIPGLKIADLIKRLQDARPDCAFALFGSRARKKSKRYSDYDLGVFRSTKLTLKEFSILLTLALDWNESQLTTVQLTNLTESDPGFAKSIRDDLIFVAGDFKSWIRLLDECGVRIYE